MHLFGVRVCNVMILDVYDLPSISISLFWATVKRLSPAFTANLCSSPSLSMKVTQSLSKVSLDHIWHCIRTYSSPAGGGLQSPWDEAAVAEKALQDRIRL